jgi:hypothetical protein
LENINGVITQTSYEPYNEFLSVKIVQTYKVDGPQLIGKATDNDGQLVTITTQRKGSNGYIPPNPTATRTVEVNREDAEALIERIVDTPEVFKANTFSVERPDPIPQKFRVAVPIQSSQEIVEGEAEIPTLEEGEISKSEEQRNKFIKRVSFTSRDQAVLPQTLTGKTTNNERQEVTVTETLQLGNTDEGPTATKTIESEALGDGNYVITKTEVPEVFGAETFRKNREDITPQKFKAAQEDSTVEQNVAGIASSAITLATGEFVKSEQQINKFVKRVSTTSRAITQAVTLLESVLTNEGQVGTRILTLASGAQSFVPSALLVDANVEALGDGRTVKTEVRVPSVFAGTTVTKTKVDLTPEKFKAAQQDTTTEQSVDGTVNPLIALGVGEFRKSEQQVTQFVKRTSITSRNVSSATTLTEFVVTPQGQLAERTLRLATGAQTIQPDERLIDGSIEALGDGRTIKTEVRVDGVFSNKTFSIERPDPTPQKFRVELPTITEEETIEGEAELPELDSGDLSKSEQQITLFTKRIATSTRQPEQDADATTLNGKIYTTELGGGLANLVEEYGENLTISPSYGTISANVEPLGAGKSVSQTVELPNIPTLSGQDYDLTFDFAVPYTQKFIEGGDLDLDGPSDITPRDRYHSLRRTYQTNQASVDSVITTYEIVNISLPDVLQEVTLYVNYDSSSDVAAGGGNTCEARASASASADADLYFKIKNGYNGPIDAEKKIFFLKKEDCTKGNIFSKLGTGVQSWPILKPQEETILVSLLSKRTTISRSVSLPANTSTALGTDTNRDWKTFTIRPTLHPALPIANSISGTATATASATAGPSGVQASVAASFEKVGTISATSPEFFPAGKYAYSINTTPYKYGLVRIEALVVDVTSAYL